MFKRQFTDFQFSEYLRHKGVINNWRSIESPAITEYWDGSELIAIAVFDNAAMVRVIYTHDLD